MVDITNHSKEVLAVIYTCRFLAFPSFRKMIYRIEELRSVRDLIGQRRGIAVESGSLIFPVGGEGSTMIIP